MPNWCQNTTYIECLDKETQKKIHDIVNKDEHGFKFSNFHPLPEDEQNNWYDWQIANWGTKWDTSGPNTENYGKKGYQITYDTAWGPGLNALKKLSSLLPNAVIATEYEEFGCDFAGVMVLHKGKAVYVKDWQPSEFATEQDEDGDLDFEYYYDAVPINAIDALEDYLTEYEEKMKKDYWLEYERED